MPEGYILLPSGLRWACFFEPGLRWYLTDGGVRVGQVRQIGRSWGATWRWCWPYEIVHYGTLDECARVLVARAMKERE